MLPKSYKQHFIDINHLSQAIQKMRRAVSSMISLRSQIYLNIMYTYLKKQLIRKIVVTIAMNHVSNYSFYFGFIYFYYFLFREGVILKFKENSRRFMKK